MIDIVEILRTDLYALTREMVDILVAWLEQKYPGYTFRVEQTKGAGRIHMTKKR
jgi:hypothetical protein